jgi:hypothetical protein
MSIVGKFFDSYINLIWKVYSYGIGHILLAIVFVLSFIVPPLKKVINEYESQATFKSIMLINFVSMTVLTIIFQVIDAYASPISPRKWLTFLSLYMVNLIFGYLALFFLADYRRRKPSES